jgi:hypothetical protein
VVHLKEKLMALESKRSNPPFSIHSGTAESVAEHRSRLAREQEDSEQRRMEALAGQVSIANNPSERIRIWEQLHGLPMPVSPTHALLKVIAEATDLQIEQVQEVQRARTTRSS